MIDSSSIKSSQPALIEPKCLTKVKAERAAAYAFSVLALAGSILAAGLVFSQTIAITWILPAAPLPLIAFAAIYWAYHLIDYENPTELETHRIEAHDLDFTALYKKHGLNNLLAHIAKENGPNVEDLKNKFTLSTEKLGFKQAALTFDVADLAKKGIITYEHAKKLIWMDAESEVRKIELATQFKEHRFRDFQEEQEANFQAEVRYKESLHAMNLSYLDFLKKQSEPATVNSKLSDWLLRKYEYLQVESLETKKEYLRHNKEGRSRFKENSKEYKEATEDLLRDSLHTATIQMKRKLYSQLGMEFPSEN